MAIPIVIEGLRGANFARVAGVTVASGTVVKAGDALFDIENHKVVQELGSPGDGVLVHALSEGEMVALDRPIAFLAQGDDDHAALLSQVRAAAPDTWPGVVADAVAPPDAGRPVTVRKATEIAVLGNGPGNSMLSMLGIPVGHVRRSPGTADFFAGKILDLLVYEVSRLLAGRKFRLLNSYFRDGAIHPHADVRAGIGFDEGGKLTLYVVPAADKLSLGELQDTIVDGLMRYVGRKLAIEDVATSTFTISDLSATPISFSLPLVPRDQCIIIAVHKDPSGHYSLVVSFDHRVTEGLLISEFLMELARRIGSFDDPGAALAVPAGPEPECSYCGRSLHVEIEEFGRKGLMTIVDAAGASVQCCSTCWGNW